MGRNFPRKEALLFAAGEAGREGKAWVWGQGDVLHDPGLHRLSSLLQAVYSVFCTLVQIQESRDENRESGLDEKTKQSH